MRMLPFFAFVLLISALAVALMKPPVAPIETPRALPALDLHALNGKRTFSADGHVMLINFFASWCGPCKMENGELALLKKQATIEGIAWNDSEKNVRRFIGDNGDPYAAIWLDNDGEAAIALGVRGVPESFVVDKKGMIRYRLAGPITADIRERILTPLLNKLEAE